MNISNKITKKFLVLEFSKFRIICGGFSNCRKNKLELKDFLKFQVSYR
jgi:hypothetical protein